MIKRIQIEGRNVLVLDFDDGGLHVVGKVFVRHAVFARAVGVLENDVRLRVDRFELAAPRALVCAGLAAVDQNQVSDLHRVGQHLAHVGEVVVEGVRVHRRDNLHDFPLARQHTAAQPFNRPDAVVFDDDALRLILLVQRFHLLRVHLVRFVEDDNGRVLRRFVFLNALFAADDQRLLPAREVVVRQHGVDELGFAAFEEAGNQVDWCKFLFAHALNSSRSAFSSMCAPMTHRRPV